MGTATTPYASSIAYAPQGAISSLKLNNGPYEETCFNSRQQVSGIRLGTGLPQNTCADPGGDVLDLGFSYGFPAGASATNNGDVTAQSIKRSSGLTGVLTQSYSYGDPATRLTQMSESGSTLSQVCAYDAFGNRAVTSGTLFASLTPQSLNSYNAKNQWSLFGYDTAGNMTNDGANNPIAYDAENRVTQSTNAGTVTTYGYDGEGRRVQKTSGGVTTTYVHDAQRRLMAEYSSAATTLGTREYVTTDHLGSTRVTTDDSGNPIACHDYLPFGEEVSPATTPARSGCYGSSDGLNLKFTGQYRDTEINLDYFGARYFSGAQGRFTSADPLGIIKQRVLDPRQWNMYAYVRNNPLRLVDPTGMYTCDGNKEQCRRVESAYNQIKAAAAKDKGLNKVLEFLGEPGKANNVAIKFGSLKPGVLGNADTTSSTDLMGTKHTITQITLDLKQTDAIMKARGGEFGATSFEVGGLLAHEGTHGRDQVPIGHNPATKGAEHATEINAYGAQSEVYMGLGLKSRVDPGLSSDNQADREKAIRDGADVPSSQNAKRHHATDYARLIVCGRTPASCVAMTST